MSGLITRVFLGGVGLLYCRLAAYCSLAPQRASQAVGFSLLGGSGQSEFLTVYGGLELGLGLLLMAPLWRVDQTDFALQVCLVVHGCLVLFRTVGFFAYSDFNATTYNLAVGEGAIFLAALGLWA